MERGILALLLLWLLVGPRVDLPGVHGLRVEDLLFAVLAAVCALHLRGFGRPSGPTIAIVGVVVTGVISAAVASARGTVDPITAVLYAVRPIEYWIAFPATVLLLRSASGLWTRRIQILLAVVTVLQTAFAIMQYYFGLPIGFSHAAYTRAAGLTVGPYELGAISAALVVYWVAHGRWTMASLASVALAASISRVSLLGAAAGVAILAAAWLLHLRRRVAEEGLRQTIALHGRPRVRTAGHLVSVAAAGLVLAFTLGLIHPPATVTIAEPPAGDGGAASTAPSADPTPSPTATASETPSPGAGSDPISAPSDSIAERLASTSLLGSWNLGAQLAAAVPPVHTSAEYDDVAYARLDQFVDLNAAEANGIDPSNLVRFFRWHFILDTIHDPVDVVFGLGPSFVGPSVDGSYLRFFADGGILGVFAWLALIVTWLRRRPLWMVSVTVSLLVGAVFIDIVYAQRPMVLFWLMLAISTTIRRSGDDASPIVNADADTAPAPVTRD